MLPPPAAVFNEWSPKDQQSYNAELDVFTKDRDAHLKEARKASSRADSAKMAQERDENVLNSNTYWQHNPEDSKADGKKWKRNYHAGQVSYYEGIEEEEQAKADAAQAKINERAITPIDNTPVNQPEIKAQYEKDLQQQLDADTKKILELRQREAELQTAIDEAYFPLITMRDEKKELEQVEAEILKVAGEIAFNTKCKVATQGPPPPPNPPQVSAPSAPIAQHFVGMGARLQCSFGAPLMLAVQRPMTLMENAPMANIMDFKPFVNIIPMGPCSAPTNPAVLAAMGSPVPCTPLVPAPWTPGKPDVLVENFPALLSTDTCLCSYAGVITINP